ncbi:MAG: hypothetical protein O6952_04800 [Planctomycetota bacterium]|nr:hypothetical protein [Planctomycetota bacterium]
MIRNRWFHIVVGLCFLSWAMQGLRGLFWVPLIAAIVIGAWLLARRVAPRALAGGGIGGGAYLCDTCKYSYGDVCNRPEKPNATKCPDYKSV